MLIFSSSDFILVFKHLSFYTDSLSNPFLIAWLTLSQISVHFSSNASFFIKNNICLITQSLLYGLIFGRIIIPKRNPFRHYYSRNVYIICWNWAVVLMKLVFFYFNMTKCFYSFCIWWYFFYRYNTPFFLLNQNFIVNL